MQEGCNLGSLQEIQSVKTDQILHPTFAPSPGYGASAWLAGLVKQRFCLPEREGSYDKVTQGRSRAGKPENSIRL